MYVPQFHSRTSWCCFRSSTAAASAASFACVLPSFTLISFNLWRLRCDTLINTTTTSTLVVVAATAKGNLDADNIAAVKVTWLRAQQQAHVDEVNFLLSSKAFQAQT